MVQELTQEDWEEHVKNAPTPIIVDFWASWCGPCKMLAPEFEALESEFEGKLKFGKISTEDFPQVASENMVTGIPCLVVFNKGEEVDRIVGFSPRDQLRVKIEAILSKI